MTRVIATPEQDHFDPFLLLDDANDYIAGFPDQPHRGFETDTYMLAGAMQHGDNQGNTGLLGPGSVQWMIASPGIVHSEMPQQADGPMWGFQLWVNLPASDKMTEPRYQDIPAKDVPEVALVGGVSVKIVAGELGGVSGPVSGVATDPRYFDVRIPAGEQASLPIPIGHNAFVYVYEGSVAIGDDVMPRGHIALLGDGDTANATASPDARMLLIAGRPLNEPVARYGPFVMNTEDEIRQAIVDYQSGRF